MTELQAAQWLRERDNFLLLTHVRPDGDTLGSAAALALARQKLGKRAWVGYNQRGHRDLCRLHGGLLSPGGLRARAHCGGGHRHGAPAAGGI